MKFKSVQVLIGVAFLFACLPAQAVLADTGPKPSMVFDFKFEPDTEVQITGGELYECDQADCKDAAPLKKLGPQGLYCDTISCRATAYGFAPYHILEVEFSDEITRRSNIFETAGFDSAYTVTVRPDDLLVEAGFNWTSLPRTATVLAACLGCLVVLGLGAGLAFFLLRRSRPA